MPFRGVSVVLFVLAALSAVPANAACNWVDGTDAAAPADDPGRGVADWRAHFAHVTDGVGVTNAHKLVADRMNALKACLDKPGYARLYADVSVLIAFYGRAKAGWKDAMDPTAPADDPGRGIASWSAHQNHVLKGAGMTNAAKLAGDRLSALAKLDKALYARIYADVSILLANYARI